MLPQYLANTIIKLAKEDDIIISLMKLQKIMYFVYRDYIQQHPKHMPLLSERFAVWGTGPVLISVQEIFKEYSYPHSVSDFYREDGEALGFDLHITTDKLFANVVQNVWNETKNLSGIELARLTQKEECAWYKAYQKDLWFLEDKDILNDKVKII